MLIIQIDKVIKNLQLLIQKFLLRRYQSSLTLRDYILFLESVLLEVNLEIKSKYRNDQRIKTFTDCNIKQLYLIILNLVAYLNLYTFRRFEKSGISCFFYRNLNLSRGQCDY